MICHFANESTLWSDSLRWKSRSKILILCTLYLSSMIYFFSAIVAEVFLVNLTHILVFFSTDNDLEQNVEKRLTLFLLLFKWQPTVRCIFRHLLDWSIERIMVEDNEMKENNNKSYLSVPYLMKKKSIIGFNTNSSWILFRWIIFYTHLFLWLNKFCVFSIIFCTFL